MTQYSAAEEAIVFQFMFPFLQAKSPSENAVNIAEQLVEKLNEKTKTFITSNYLTIQIMRVVIIT